MTEGLTAQIRLDGKVALVTGGGSGIGREIAEMLASAGASVAVTGRREDVLEEAVRAIEVNDGRAVAVAGDVSDPAHAAHMVEQTVERLGGLHILVNNAGISRNGSLESMADEDVDALIDIDLKGPIFVTRAAVPHLREHKAAGGAAVINISSSVTLIGVKNFSIYSAAKAGVDQLTRCWALDLAEDGIRVNAINPGIVETPIFDTMMPADQIQSALDYFAGTTPLGRVGQPRDIARVALFLASPMGAWVTGAIVPADGGLSLGTDK